MERKKQDNNEKTPAREVKFKGASAVEGEKGLINIHVEIDGVSRKIRTSVDEHSPQEQGKTDEESSS